MDCVLSLCNSLCTLSSPSANRTMSSAYPMIRITVSPLFIIPSIMILNRAGLRLLPCRIPAGMGLAFVNVLLAIMRVKFSVFIFPLSFVTCLTFLFILCCSGI